MSFDTLCVKRNLIYLGLLIGCLMPIQAALAQSDSDPTAKEDLSEVIAAAREVNDQAQLIAIVADDLFPNDGEAASFTYLFAEPDLSDPFLVIKEGGEIVALDIDTGLGLDGGALIDVFVPPNAQPVPLGDLEGLFDSDEALQAVLESGGAAFRDEHGRTKAFALLVNVPLSLILRDASLIDAITGGLTRPFWLVTLAAPETNEFRVFAVDAQTGATRSVSFAPAPAKANLEAARQAIEDRGFAPDAELIFIGSLLPDINNGGESLVWRYRFYSNQEDEAREVYVSDGQVIAVIEPVLEVPSKRSLPEEYIGSRRAAEIAGNNIETVDVGSEDVLVASRLARGILPEQPSRAIWQFSYLTEGTVTTVFIDATTGQVIGEDEPAPEGLAVTSFTLINAKTDEPIGSLEEGDKLDLSALPPFVNVRANTQGTVESVRFELDGNTDFRRDDGVENRAPFALATDIEGDFARFTFEPGEHTLTAVPFTLDHANGEKGEALTISFTVTDGSQGNKRALAATEQVGIPNRVRLMENYPNPFNPTTTIRYGLPESRHVRLTIYNIRGRAVATLVDAAQAPGWHTIQWNATGYPSGVYFYRLETGNRVEAKKLILMK